MKQWDRYALEVYFNSRPPRDEGVERREPRPETPHGASSTQKDDEYRKKDSAEEEEDNE